jgi:hypothetical protein
VRGTADRPVAPGWNGCTVTSRRSPIEKIERFTLSSAPVASAMRSTTSAVPIATPRVVSVERSRERA